MNILILGLGEVGFHLSKVLSESGHDVTVVDNDPIRVKRVGESLDVQTLCGDVSHPDVLDDADAAAADLVLAVSNDDRVNLIASLFCKRMGAAQAIVRVKDIAPYAGFRTFMRKNLLFDEMLSLEELAAEEIAKVVRRNQAVAVENFLEGKVTLRVVPVKDESKLAGKVLREVEWPRDLNVVAVRRDGSTLIPGGDFEFHVDDEVYLLGLPEVVEEFEAWVGDRKTRTRNVVIFGESSTAFHAARSLTRQGIKVRILIEERESAELYADKIDPQTKVLHVGSANAEVFKEEHVGKADAFVGASDVDEKNLLACLLAGQLGCKRTIALVSSPTYSEIYKVVGIDRAVSPRILCSEAIVARVQAGKLRFMAAFDEGAATVCAGRIPLGSTIANKKLSEAGFPKGCVVGAVQRTVDGVDQVVIPRGGFEFQEKDELVFFLLKAVEPTVYQLLESTE
ncbi:MAG: Trk system potassium transporter TrkA [Planctomycetota bacterium]